MIDPFSTAQQIADLVRTKEVSPVEVAETYLDRIERINPAVNAVVWLDADAVRAAAVRAEQAVLRGDPLGPLHGVPVPIKDLSSLAGQPNTMSSLAIRDTPQTVTDPDVQLLLDSRRDPPRPDELAGVRRSDRLRERPARQDTQPVEPGTHLRRVERRRVGGRRGRARPGGAHAATAADRSGSRRPSPASWA